MDEYSQKYLLDVKNACEEVESFFKGKKNFANFQTDILRQRAVERKKHIPKLLEDVQQLLAC